MQKSHASKYGIWFSAVALTLFSSAYADTLTKFSAPGAGTTAGAGTMPTAINGSGVITGDYLDSAFVDHGFVRTTDGTITGFDASGVGLNTYAVAINNSGTVTGTFYDANDEGYGFVRISSGVIYKFSVPGSAGPGTVAGSINDSGTVTGSWGDANFVSHGFVRLSNGTITSFDVPGAGTSFNQGTVGYGINGSGTVTGLWVDASNSFHGFLRTSGGVITTFDVPALVSGPGQGTFPSSINASGAVTGNYSGSNVTGSAGFIRAADGTFTTFQPVASVDYAFINAPGGVVGIAEPQSFVRTPAGKIGYFQVDGDLTFAYGMNASYVVTGSYIDSSNVSHGFILTP